MYAASPDPYCYDGTSVLKNLLDIRDEHQLAAFEKAVTDQRADEPMPAGRFSVTHYRAIHHHLFQDVYAWAGKFRTIRLAKGGNSFCYPEHIEREMRGLFGFLAQQRGFRGSGTSAFVIAATSFLTVLNAIHPFREGNGRTQLTFLTLLAHEAGHPLELDHLAPQRFLAAMIASFHGDEEPLRKELTALVGKG